MKTSNGKNRATTNDFGGFDKKREGQFWEVQSKETARSVIVFAHTFFEARRLASLWLGVSTHSFFGTGEPLSEVHGSVIMDIDGVVSEVCTSKFKGKKRAEVSKLVRGDFIVLATESPELPEGSPKPQPVVENESTFVAFARRELEIWQKAVGTENIYGESMVDAVMKLVETFAAEGHSGMSASLAISLFERLAKYQPLTPLTGADDEWIEISNEMLSKDQKSRVKIFQNNRCSRVFKEVDIKTGSARAYDGEGKIFRDSRGSYTNKDSNVDVVFPYQPATQ